MPDKLIYPLALLRNLAEAPDLRGIVDTRHSLLQRLREQTLVEMVDYFVSYLTSLGYNKESLLNQLQQYIDRNR